MRRYAEYTSVSVEKSRAEIDAMLDRYGAQAVRTSRTSDRAMVEFWAHERQIRFVLPLPDRDSDDFKFTKYKNRAWQERRTEEQQFKHWEQACRQRWRALSLAIKAKLECVECGISQFEDEFLSYIVDPLTNRTVGEVVRPQLALKYDGDETRQLKLEGPKPLRVEVLDET